MSDDADRRSPDAALFRELYGQLSALGRKMDELGERMEEITGLRVSVENHNHEIIRLRDKVDSANVKITTLEAQKVHADTGEAGGIYVSPGWLAVFLAAAGAAITALWQIIQWIMDAIKNQHGS